MHLARYIYIYIYGITNKSFSFLYSCFWLEFLHPIWSLVKTDYSVEAAALLP